ncbi:unnamed protein product [Vitrella brassicaformis CCMP3155]|uniref:Heme-binding protein 2 n=1 Tax=Vitrella brassicaformis (strain CCMP3155) TaxID=1169540 RepID=A0A0G4EI25_VITBC|nr:unnamed protein product [Vitrella brassicaformis CCMP3155]|eukprot:CEL95892.1 unnamed protein product [Vitrella brassicaformis CCMP3155]
MKVLVPLLLLVGAAMGEWEKPWFCHDIDCPEFEIQTSDEKTNYEERTYGPTMWVSTKIQTTDWNMVGATGFQRLFGYISGQNDNGTKIEMTAPVLTEVMAGPGPACGSDFVVSFYISESVANPPKPTNPDVYLQKRPPMRVAVTQYGGFTYNYEKKIVPHIETLTKDIEERGEKYSDPDAPVLYVAGYDPPFRFFNRHNEVWLRLADKVVEEEHLI